ncbi:MAG: ClbS/DfsB family four-helix bundle protein [Roseovarius sp.]|nr:ClbS/DfsB family four-helix bundle protein [Roseovarius sp.]
MPIPASREELLDAIETNFERLAGYVGTVPAQKTGDATLERHSKGMEMSVRNLASYLLGWNNPVPKWIKKDAKGESVDFPETCFK